MTFPELKRVRGCIFDFDGTIIISEHVHMKAWEDLAQDLSLELPPDFLEHSVGMSDKQLVKILSGFWNYSLTEQDILERKRKFYMIRCPKEVTVVPGVLGVIDALHEKKVPLAIATSSARCEVEPILKSLGIFRKFEGICTVEDITHPKPDPEIYKCAAQRLGFKPNECLAFEDSIAGVNSARTAGCVLVTIQTLYTADRLGPALLSVKDFHDHSLPVIINAISH